MEQVTITQHRRRWPRFVAAASVIAVSLGTVAAFVFSWRAEDRSWGHDERSRTMQVGAIVQRTIVATTVALRGASGMVDATGAVTPDRWNRYAPDVSQGSSPLALAYLPLVKAADRAAYEASAGRPITSVAADGRSVAPAPSRPLYLPVEYIWPEAPTEQRLLGFDLLSSAAQSLTLDQVLASGAQEIVVLKLGNTAALFTARSVTGPDGSTVGLISAAFQADQLTSRVASQAPPGTRFSVRGGNALVVAGVPKLEGDHNTVTTVAAAGLQLQVTVIAGGGAARALAWFVLSGGGLLAIFLTIFFVFLFLSERRLQAANSAAVGAQSRTSGLLEISTAISATSFPYDVGRAAVLAGRFVGSSGGVLVTAERTPEDIVLHPVFWTGFDDADVEYLDGLSTATRTPFGAAIRGAASVTKAAGAWSVGVADAAFAREAASAIVVPVMADGVVLGALGYTFDRARLLGEEDLSLIGSIAVQTGPALARSELLEREHRIAEVLQRRLLPVYLPKLDDIDVAVRYSAGARGAALGGDWYDVVPLDGGRAALVVGDVVGKGPEAAAVMAQLRSALDAYLVSRPDLADALQALNDFSGFVHDAMGSTCIAAVIDPPRGTVTYARVGHLPALVVRGRQAQFLEGGSSPPLGLHQAPVQAETAHLDPGDLVILYTDGLVERRDEDIDVCLERLRVAAAAVASQDIESIADHLLATVPLDPPSDDVALLVAQFRRA